MSTLEPATRAATWLGGYRELVADLGRQLAPYGPADADAVARRVEAALRCPTAVDVLAAGGTDVADLTGRVHRLAHSFTPSRASTAQSLAHHVTILLLQQIDLAWWSNTPDLPTQAAIVNAAEFIDMKPLRRAGQIKFNYTLASDRLAPRAKNYAIRHLFPDLAPGSPGPSTSLARPEVIGLLNAIAEEFARRTDGRVPALWVNCITRSVENQCRLQELGFAAHLPSAHCRGWAADIEVAWFARFGADRQLVEILAQYQDDGLLNAIDEGQIWHVCPNPATISMWTV